MAELKFFVIIADMLKIKYNTFRKGILDKKDGDRCDGRSAERNGPTAVKMSTIFDEARHIRIGSSLRHGENESCLG